MKRLSRFVLVGAIAFAGTLMPEHVYALTQWANTFAPEYTTEALVAIGVVGCAVVLDTLSWPWLTR